MANWQAAVVATYPHDPASFTQGLELRDGLLYESGGGFGASFVSVSNFSVSDFDTSSVVRRSDLPKDVFAEGITVAGDKLWQITWRNGVAMLRDKSSLEVLREVPYSGEGWGICYQATENRLVMSDGGAELTLRDPAGFGEIRRVTITLDGRPLDRLNELECAGSVVWANVWERDYLVRIDLDQGKVTGVVHFGRLPDFGAGILNGIAALPGTDDLLITGKNWPHLYRVRLETTAAPAQ